MFLLMILIFWAGLPSSLLPLLLLLLLLLLLSRFSPV